MKKLVFFFAALFIPYFAQAQGGISLGLKAGANYSSLTGDNTNNLKHKFGFHGGGFLDFGLSDMVSIRPELLFSVKGYSVETTSDDDDNQSFSYIDVPILAHVYADGIFFEGGPTLGYMVAVKEGDTADFKKLEFGYAAGLGYEMESGMGFGLRYQGGLTSLSDNDNDPKQKNSVFQLYLSYLLGGR
ncbi:porin family protein [Rufibacter soli]